MRGKGELLPSWALYWREADLNGAAWSLQKTMKDRTTKIVAFFMLCRYIKLFLLHTRTCWQRGLDQLRSCRWVLSYPCTDSFPFPQSSRKGRKSRETGWSRKKRRGYHPYCIASLALPSLIFLVNTLRDESVVNTTCHLTEHWGGTEHHITAIPVPLVQGQKEKKRGAAKNCLLKQSNCRLTKTIHNHLLSRYNLELTWWNKVVSDTTRTRKGLWKCDRQNFILRYGRRKCLKNAFRRSGEDPNMVEQTAWETHSAGLEKSPNVVIYH